MKHTFRLLLFLVVVVSIALLSALPASAGSATINGVLAPGGTTMPVVFISTPNCTGQGATLVLYDAYKFTVDTGGTYDFGVTSPGGAIHLYLMDAAFTPAAAYPNCLAASNNNPTQFSYALTAGTIYYLVPFDDSLGQAGDSYSATISGPGTICLGGVCGAEEEEVAVPGCDVTIAIPSTAVGATITADTPVYWKPGAESDETFPAGLNVRAIGVDESGMYTKVVFACGYYWVPTSVIGPNYDAPWNGAPLPTAVVE